MSLRDWLVRYQGSALESLTRGKMEFAKAADRFGGASSVMPF